MTDVSPSTAPPTDARVLLDKLYHIVLREVEDVTTITEIDPDLYRQISEFIGNLRRQRYSGVEDKVKEQAVAYAANMTTLLLATRLEKAAVLRVLPRDFRSKSRENTTMSVMQRLLDEEKFILDSEEERVQRRDVILSATKRGRTKFLESISENHKTGRIVVRFLRDAESVVGVDMEMYGPFRAEDIVTIPHENALALIAEDVAVRVRWEDYGQG